MFEVEVVEFDASGRSGIANAVNVHVIYVFAAVEFHQFSSLVIGDEQCRDESPEDKARNKDNPT